MSRAGQAIAESSATCRAVESSREQWLKDLKTLLLDAKGHFADVYWTVEGDSERIYGHKAILYARANASFQTRYLNPSGNARLQAIMSGSELMLPLDNTVDSDSADSSCAISLNAKRYSESKEPVMLQCTESAFFKSLLDFLYTASTNDAAVLAFLFEHGAFAQSRDNGIERLSQDLLFIWRSKLFTDLQLQIANASDSVANETVKSGIQSDNTVFSAHRAILASRCPYFASMLLSPYSDTNTSLYTLPESSFTVAALHFALAYMYTGSLDTNRHFDLSVAMQIWRAAQYLDLNLLLIEVESRMTDMCHAFRGCCKSCRTRATRIFCFSYEPDVNSVKLQRPSRTVVLAHFGDVASREIGELSYTIQKDLVIDLCKATTPDSATDAVRIVCQIRRRLATETGAWVEHLRSMLIPLEERIRHFLRTSFAEMAISQSFCDLLDGIGFSYDTLEALFAMLVECLTEKTVAETYAALVGKVLLREQGIGMNVRACVEETRQSILRYIQNRWVNVRAMNGFTDLEKWCLKELSDELEIPTTDLIETTDTTRSVLTRTGLRLASTKSHTVQDKDYSVATGPKSQQASLLDRSTARNSVASSKISNTFSTVSSRTHRNTQLVAGASNNSSHSSTPKSITANRTLENNPAVIPSTLPYTRPAVTSSESPEPLHTGTGLRPLLVNAKSAVPIAFPQSNESPTSRNVQKQTISAARPKASASPHASTSTYTTAVSRGGKNMVTKTKPSAASSVADMATVVADSRVATSTSRSRSKSDLSKKSIRASSTKGSENVGKGLAESVARRTAVTAEATDQSAPVNPRISRRPSSAASAGSAKSAKTAASTTSISSRMRVKRPEVPAMYLKRIDKSDQHDNVNNEKRVTYSKQFDSQKKCAEKAPGSILRVGIPCVVTCGAQRFKATVRYLGEVFFDQGTYVGVEVPFEGNDADQNLFWNNGTVDGITYFELGRQSFMSVTSNRGSIPSGKPQCAVSTPGVSSKGLFVRPSQVLYVF